MVEFETYAAVQGYSAGTLVEQYITVAGAASFRLFTSSGTTKYRILTMYGGTNATNNITSPSGAGYTLTGDTTLKVGMQDTGLTQVAIQSPLSSLTLGKTGTLRAVPRSSSPSS
jgi:hypothetical protein